MRLDPSSGNKDGNPSSGNMGLTPPVKIWHNSNQQTNWIKQMDEDKFLDVLNKFITGLDGIDMEQVFIGDEEVGEITISFTGLVKRKEIV